MIPGDLGADLLLIVRDAVTAGDLPAVAAGLAVSGTWRPPPGAVAPGSYATSLPFAIAALGHPAPAPAAVAALLADRLRAGHGVAAATADGGYLTVTVTTRHLTALPARVIAAGPAALRTGALAGTVVPAAPLPDLAQAAGWRQAWRWCRDAIGADLAGTAGAVVTDVRSQREAAPSPARDARTSPVRAALARYGHDAVRYALARTASGSGAGIDRALAVPLNLDNPFVTVRYAHADAASVRRWAGDLGLPREPARADLLVAPAELSLLTELSWLPERVAAAARRCRPAELAASLEDLAGAWLDCRESCPALPFGGRAAPPEPALAAARLLLADATAIMLAAGLRLLGVGAPDRLPVS